MGNISIQENSAPRKEILDTKQWLWQYRDAKKRVRRIEAEYRELVSIQESVGAVSYDGMPKVSGNISDLSGIVMARDNILSKLIKATRKAASTHTQIISAVEQLDTDIEKDIIFERYIHLKDNCDERDWDEIARKLNFSEQHIYRVHGIALGKLTQYRKHRRKNESQ